MRRILWPVLCAGLVLVSGCATPLRLPIGDDSHRSLDPTPTVSAGVLRADRAILAAFLAANGIQTNAEELQRILPNGVVLGRMDRDELRQTVRRNKRLLLVVEADETYLWEELLRNRPLLLYLPTDLRYHQVSELFIPVAWDRSTGMIDLLDGSGQIRTLPAVDFFIRREPLKQAAICLLRQNESARMAPTRSQKLLLADFWYDQGNYRLAEAAYSALQEEVGLEGSDVQALLGHANSLVKQKKYAQAIPIYRQALLLEPEDPKILNNLAYAMVNGGGELMVALRHATKANRLDPTNPLILETLGTINFRLGDYESAAKLLERAWARSLRKPPEVQIAIMDQLARAWLGTGREDLAWQVAETRARLFPEYRFPRDLRVALPNLKNVKATPSEP